MNYSISGSAHNLFPIDLFYGLLYTDTSVLEIPKRYPFCGEWGNSISTDLSDDNLLPCGMEINFLSIIEKKFYHLQQNLNIEEPKCIEVNGTKTLIIGMAPYGGVAIWMYTTGKSYLVDWTVGQCVNVDMKDFVPMNPDISLKDYCDFYINKNQQVKDSLENNGIPPYDLFDNYMKQFMYRYQVLIEKWKDQNEDVKWEKYEADETAVEFDYIEEALYDGTHDKLHDGEQMKYHEAGKPKKLKVEMHKGKTEWLTYLWFEDKKIREVFDRFYGAHPDTKTDFIIHIDAERKKYELALYRYGLKEPQIIPEDVYQLIVFKNKFENYRSDNYNQEWGAWIW